MKKTVYLFAESGWIFSYMLKIYFMLYTLFGKYFRVVQIEMAVE